MVQPDRRPDPSRTAGVADRMAPAARAARPVRSNRPGSNSRRQVEDSRRTSARSAPKRSTAASTMARQKASWPGRNSRASWISTTPDRSLQPIHGAASGVRSAPSSAARMRGSGEAGATGAIAGSPGLGVSAAIILMGCRLAFRISAWNDMVPLPSGRERRTTDCGMRGRNGRKPRPRHPRYSVNRKADLRTVRLAARVDERRRRGSAASSSPESAEWEEDLIKKRLVGMDRPRDDRGRYQPDASARVTVSPCGASGKTSLARRAGIGSLRAVAGFGCVFTHQSPDAG